MYGFYWATPYYNSSIIDYGYDDCQIDYTRLLIKLTKLPVTTTAVCVSLLSGGKRLWPREWHSARWVRWQQPVTLTVTQWDAAVAAATPVDSQCTSATVDYSDSSSTDLRK